MNVVVKRVVEIAGGVVIGLLASEATEKIIKVAAKKIVKKKES